MMFLLLVTVASMLLAAIMSVVAWRIAGDERRRSEARIAALAAAIHDAAAGRVAASGPLAISRSATRRSRARPPRRSVRDAPAPARGPRSRPSAAVGARGLRRRGRVRDRLEQPTRATRRDATRAAPAAAGPARRPRRASRARRARPRARRRSADGPRRRPQSCVGAGAGPADRGRAPLQRRRRLPRQRPRRGRDAARCGPAAKRRSRSPCRAPPTSAGTASASGPTIASSRTWIGVMNRVSRHRRSPRVRDSLVVSLHAQQQPPRSRPSRPGRRHRRSGSRAASS